MSASASTHPAGRTAARAMAAVAAHDRDAWLARFADDAVVHDPVGGSPLDPDGVGLRGRGDLERFWDLTVAPNDVTFDVAAVHAAGDEAAVVASVGVAFATGTTVSYDGVFLYRVDAGERITELRAYWDLDTVMQALLPEPSAD